MMKSMKIFTIMTVTVLAAMILSACGAAAPAEPTQDPNAIFTQVAETVMVSMTQTSEAMPPTAMPEPTATTKPTDEALPAFDVTIEPTNDPFSYGPTVTMQHFGDSAKYNTQTPADGTVFKPSQNFRMTVCFGNNGSTIWNNTYYLEWMSGYRLWTPSKYTYVGEEIEPGEKWCFTLQNIAPPDPGSYITRWYFKNGDSQYMEEFYFNFKVAS